MINLLPPEEKDALLENERKKIVAILGSLVLFFLVFSTLVLFLIENYQNGKIEEEKLLFQKAQKESEQSAIKNLQEKIDFVDKRFAQLNNFYQKQIQFAPLLEKISAALPSKIVLSAVSFSFLKDPETKKEELQISLSGFSPEREIIGQLKENLESQEAFKDVYFPPSNWIKPINIDFNATFKLNEPR